MRVPRRELGAYRLYLAMEFGTSFLLGITSATVAVYWVTTGGLNPLQLVLLGTSLELSYFLFQLPTRCPGRRRQQEAVHARRPVRHRAGPGH
jgi:hypothetical protein